jgi:hypothetical protein
MKIILLLFSLNIFASCSVYHYTTVASNTIEKNKEGVFVTENDSLGIEYSFGGYGGPVSIKIINKTNLPLFIDWKRSAIIVNNKAISYFNPGSRIDGTISSDFYQLSDRQVVGQATLNADLKAQDGEAFIPPNAYSQNTFINLSSFFNNETVVEQMKRQKLYIKGGEQNLLKIDFSESSSPLIFKSYITFMYADSAKKYFTRQHDFYISSSTKTSLSPEEYFVVTIPGDTFITSRFTGTSQFVGVTAILGGIILAAIVSPDKGDTKQ